MITHRFGRYRSPLIYFALLLLILLAFALRLYQLDQYSFWTDEGLTPERSGYSLPEILQNVIYIQGYETKDTHPPLYYLLVHLTRQLFGDSDFAFRYPSVLFGVLLVPLLWRFGRLLDDKVTRWQGDKVNTSHPSTLSPLHLVSALLVAVNPLQIYYSQEARMYTLLVFLGAGGSYLLWRALARPNPTRRQLARDLGLYILLAGLALYTHYTAVFLIAIQGIFWLWLLWRAGLQRWIIGLGVAAVLLAIPLVPYTIPRLFAGAEANYHLVAPLVMLQDVVHFFSLGLTTDFNHLWVRLLDLFVLVLLLLGLWAAGSWRKRLFLLGYLLAVLLGLMAGSYLIKPMYQGARHIMLGSPAFILLMASAIQSLFASGKEEIKRLRDWETRKLKSPSLPISQSPNLPVSNLQSLLPTPHSPLSTLFGLLALLLTLSGAAVSLNNLYHNPAYGKDDFRRLIRYIEQRAGANDVVVYNNAVLLPLHGHYRVRPDVEVTALPVYPQFATGQEPELAALAEQYDRIWFITDPPADKRDEGKLTQGWLDDNLSEVDGRLFPARTTEARTIAYDTGVTQVDEWPAEMRPLDIQWNGLPALRGAVLTVPEPIALPTLWVDLFWEGELTLERSAVPLRFVLHGPDGREWETRDRNLLLEWEEWRATVTRHRISYSVPLPIGLPPGEYTVVVGPKDGQEAQPLLTTAIASTSAWPASVVDIYGEEAIAALIAGPPAIRFENGLALQAADIFDVEVRPGHNLPLTLYWRAQQPLNGTGLTYRLEVVGPDGKLLREQTDPAGASWLEAWSAGELVQQNTGLYFYPETEPGRYTLRWTLQQDEGTINGRRPWQPWSNAAVEFGRVEVRPWPLESELPEDVTLVEADFGTLAQLYGYTVAADNGILELALTWQAAEPTETSYLVFVHVVPEVGGEPVTQADRFPVDNLRPTTGWRTGEVLRDVYQLPLPADLQPGRYTIYVGLYNPDDGQRLPVTVDGVAQPDGRLSLTNLELP